MRKSLFVVALFLVVALLATMTFAQRDDEYDEAFFNVVDQVKTGLLPPEILDEYEAGTPALADDLSLDIDRVPLDLDRIPLDLSDLSIPVGIIDDAQLRRIVNEDGIPLEKLFSDEDTPDYAVRVDGRIVTQELLNELLNDLEDEVDIDATLERFEALQRMQNPTPRFDDADIVVRNADGFLQQDATNLISITPSFDVATPSAEGHQRYTFSFTIISKVWLPYFTIHMAQPEHYSFSGQFGTCTINGFQVDPVLLTAESRDDLVKSIFFDTPIDAAMTTVIECRDAVLQGAASAQPSDAVMFVESSTSHAATGEDMVLLSETNFDRKLPRTTWYYIFGMVLLSVVALTVGILALVAYQKKKNGAATTINKAGAKIVDTSAEKAKPEEQQSLLSAPDQQPYVSIV